MQNTTNNNINGLPSKQPFNPEDLSKTKNNLHSSSQSRGADPDRAERRLLERLMQNKIHSRSAQNEIGTSSSSQQQQLFIPNPFCFTCDWLYCQQADLLSDLRQTWLGALYKTTLSFTFSGSGEPKTTSARPSEEVEEKDERKTMPSVSSTMPFDVLRGHQDALNAELARELNIRWSGRLVAEREKRRRQLLSSQNSKGLKPHSSNGESNNETNNSEEDDINELFLREEAKAAKGLCKVGSYGLKNLRNTWLRTAMRHLLKDRSSKSFYGDEEGESVALSAFCWVVCENCGKLRRVAQPFPGGVPFICALSRSIGSCKVPEVEGLISCTADLTEVELRRAVFASAILPYPLHQYGTQLHTEGEDLSLTLKEEPISTKRNGNAGVKREEAKGNGGWGGAKDDEPFMQELRSELGQRLVALLERVAESHSKSPSATHKRQKNNGYRNDHGISLIESALPLLKDLSARVQKRLLGTFAKQIMTIPQEIRTKRDDILKASFLDEPAKVEEENVVKEKSTIKQPLEAVENKHLKKSAVANFAVVQRETTPPDSNVQNEKRKRGVELSEDAPRMRRRKAMSKTYEHEASPKSAELPTSDIKAPAGLPSRRQKEITKPLVVKSEELDTSGPGNTQILGVKRIRLSRDEVKLPLSNRTSMSSKVEDQAPVVKRKKGRPPKQNTELEIVFWVRCDICNKWRIVSQPIPDNTTFWECKLRDDKTTCAMMDDEIMLKSQSSK
ncbi:unnamed protein product [Phytomonas sp. Hart1]|nr:unnamed protein product [Phytomonas sp. Hart1]|eukprot:CCW66207.1 unnamed protein product [Phytomonas sp. isolate Hart1]